MGVQRQKPVKGGREPISGCAIKAIRDEVGRQAARFGVSKSFVIMVALADQFGIDEQEQYQDKRTRGWKKPMRLVGRG